jgi:hypothetical protein
MRPSAGPLGILMLDTAFPRVPGDVGCAASFPFPTRYAVVAHATPGAVVPADDAARWLAPFAAAARTLVDDGCIAIATTCGFLARWQSPLAAALPVPVLTSALLQVPLVARTLAPGRRVGIVTYSAPDLDATALVGAGVAPDTPVEGVAPHGRFATTIRDGAATLDAAAMAEEVAAAAMRLVARRPDVGALVLECANMGPYRGAVAQACGLPVFEACALIAWFYRGVAGPGAADLW